MLGELEFNTRIRYRIYFTVYIPFFTVPTVYTAIFQGQPNFDPNPTKILQMSNTLTFTLLGKASVLLFQYLVTTIISKNEIPIMGMEASPSIIIL